MTSPPLLSILMVESPMSLPLSTSLTPPLVQVTSALGQPRWNRQNNSILCPRCPAASCCISDRGVLKLGGPGCLEANQNEPCQDQLVNQFYNLSAALYNTRIFNCIQLLDSEPTFACHFSSNTLHQFHFPHLF